MATCDVCHINLDPNPPHDFYVCPVCRENNPGSTHWFFQSMLQRGCDEFSKRPEDRYQANLSKNGFLVTQGGGAECWCWVIEHDGQFNPIEIPTGRDDSCVMPHISGPYTYNVAVAVREWLEVSLSSEVQKPRDIFDFTGFLMTQGYGKYTLSTEEVIDLIHWGHIRYVYHSVGFHRIWHFPRSQSIVTSFAGNEMGHRLIQDLVELKHIQWSQKYRVYVTRYFNEADPPFVSRKLGVREL